MTAVTEDRPSTPAPRRSPRYGAVAYGAWAGALTVLGLVFSAYLSPDLALALATRAWSCF